MELPVYAVVMAGGKGHRMWPLSRTARPKQFLSLHEDGTTLLQQAVRRAGRVVGANSRVLVVVQEEHATAARGQLPDVPPENIISEPFGRDTAACLSLAALHVERREKDAVLLTLPADHMFVDEAPWEQAVRRGVSFAAGNEYLVCIGLEPRMPSPNYGYLRIGEVLSPNNNEGEMLPVYDVKQFVEKPPIEAARRMYDSGEYLWNTGTFAWRVDVFQAALQEHAPEIYKPLRALSHNLQDATSLARTYTNLPTISVDYALLEKARRVAAVAGKFERIDVGNLASLSEIFRHDENGNAVHGDLVGEDAYSNVVYTDAGLVGLIGVEDMVIVRQGDIVLVAPKNRAGDIKTLVEKIRREQKDDYL